MPQRILWITRSTLKNWNTEGSGDRYGKSEAISLMKNGCPWRSVTLIYLGQSGGHRCEASKPFSNSVVRENIRTTPWNKLVHQSLGWARTPFPLCPSSIKMLRILLFNFIAYTRETISKPYSYLLLGEEKEEGWKRGKRKKKREERKKRNEKERSRYWRRVRGPDIGTPTFIVTNDTAVNSPLTPSRVGSSKQERTCPFYALSLHSSSFFFFSFPFLLSFLLDISSLFRYWKEIF